MSSRIDSWAAADQAAFAHVQDLFVAESYRDSLIAASNLLTRAGQTAETGVERVLLEIISECTHELLSTNGDRKIDPSCSFCGRAPGRVIIHLQRMRGRLLKRIEPASVLGGSVDFRSSTRAARTRNRIENGAGTL